MNESCLLALDLLHRALRLMDAEGMHHVAARIAMAIDDLACEERCQDAAQTPH